MDMTNRYRCTRGTCGNGEDDYGNMPLNRDQTAHSKWHDKRGEFAPKQEWERWSSHHDYLLFENNNVVKAAHQNRETVKFLVENGYAKFHSTRNFDGTTVHYFVPAGS